METADVHEVLCVFAIMAFMGWYADAVAMKKAMKTIRIHAKYYPKKYIMPGRKVRKLLKLEKKEIPKWIYRTFLMSFVYIFVFVISTALILVLKGDAQIFVAGISAYIYEGLWMCDVIRRLIFLPLYKK